MPDELKSKPEEIDEERIIEHNNRRIDHLQRQIDRFAERKARFENNNIDLMAARAARLDKETKDKGTK